MRHLRLVTFTFALALLGMLVARADARAPAVAEPRVSCARSGLRAHSGFEDGHRVLLGAVSVPGAPHLAAASERTAGRHWRWYRNAGLAIRAGTSDVTVSVPVGWRDRVALSWGDTAASSSLTFARCDRSGARSWNAYSGGFHLRAKAGCVPLHVTVGGMSTTVRLGIGRACGRT